MVGNLPDAIQKLLDEMANLQTQRERLDQRESEIRGDLDQWQHDVAETLAKAGVVGGGATGGDQVRNGDGEGRRGKRARPPSQKDLVIKAVRDASKPVRVAQVEKILHALGHDDIPSGNVRAHLAKAVKDGDLGKAGKGLYQKTQASPIAGL